jgi:pimeloyl-ACP methyl ester carboxylesterase
MMSWWSSFGGGELVFDVSDSGPADGQVVVLLHGWPQSAAAWTAVIRQLTAAVAELLVASIRPWPMTAGTASFG